MIKCKCYEIHLEFGAAGVTEADFVKSNFSFGAAELYALARIGINVWLGINDFEYR